jgi:hypothetical protein
MMSKEMILHVLNNAKYDVNLLTTNVEYINTLNQWASRKLDFYELYESIYCDGIYRIRPEPKFIEYTKDDWRDLLGKIFVPKDKQYNSILISGYDEEELIYNDIDGNAYVSYDYLLKHYTHLDGNPAGKLIGE